MEGASKGTHVRALQNHRRSLAACAGIVFHIAAHRLSLRLSFGDTPSTPPSAQAVRQLIKAACAVARPLAGEHAHLQPTT
eukprot:5272534-Alexandrium_andersonii.AAC.1